MGHLEHKSDIRAKKSLNFYIITLSDTRTENTDESGNFIKNCLSEACYKISGYIILNDDKDLLQKEIVTICSKRPTLKIDVIITNGGTGVSHRDTAYEALSELYDKELYGFGEIFRYLSFLEIGSSAIMSRASCGLYNDKIIFSIPGSINAVQLVMNKIILGEAGHIFYEITKQK
jgi:molybdenum cofactor biosynthesis protein B